MLDERTAEILEKVDEEIKRQYIIEEYKAKLTDRKETRRHASLENSLYVTDEKTSVEIYRRNKELYAAINALTDKQREVFYSRVIENKSFRQIGDELGIHKQTVLEIYNAAVKKLKKILE